MGGVYGDAAEGSHQHGYLSRWQSRGVFLSSLYHLAPQVHTELLKAEAIASVLEPARWFSARYSTSLGKLFHLLLFHRKDGLFAGTDWFEEDFRSHPDYSLLPQEDVDRIDRAIERWGEDSFIDEWSSRMVTYEDIGLPIKDAMRLFRHSDDDGQHFVSCLNSYSPSLLRHLTRWARGFNINEPWMLMVGGLTILETAAKPDHPPEGFVLPLEWAEWHQEFRETWLPESSLIVRLESKWNPRTEKRAEARKRIRSRLDNELDRVESAAHTLSETLPTKTQLEHFEWLVRYQVLRRRHSNIASEVFRERVTVLDGIKRAAQLVELTLRAPDPVGRPTGSMSADN